MGKILGIIGGGQLGMMIAEAAKDMSEEIEKVIVLDPAENCPASQVGAEQIVADFKDREAIIELSKRSDIITYEIESGDSDGKHSKRDNCTCTGFKTDHRGCRRDCRKDHDSAKGGWSFRH